MKIKMLTDSEDNQLTKLKSEITYLEAFSEFLDSCKVKNLSQRTIGYYQLESNRFLRYCSEECEIEDNELLLSDCDHDFIFGYIGYLQEGKANDITVASYVRAIRAIFYFLMKHGFTTYNFTIPIPKTDEPIKETYTDAELKILLKKPKVEKDNFVEYKTWVIENYVLATGNRLGTLANLQIKDVDFDGENIILRRTKSRRQQIVPMAQSLKNILKEYIRVLQRNGIGEPDDYLFPNANGIQAKLHTLEVNVRDYNRKRGVTKTSLHAFRHTFAKIFILRGGDPFRLQKLLGHTDLTVTRMYVNMFSGDLKVDYDKFNPLDALTNTGKRVHNQ